jgi:hypothetical protein
VICDGARALGNLTAMILPAMRPCSEAVLAAMEPRLLAPPPNVNQDPAKLLRITARSPTWAPTTFTVLLPTFGIDEPPTPASTRPDS